MQQRKLKPAALIITSIQYHTITTHLLLVEKDPEEAAGLEPAGGEESQVFVLVHLTAPPQTRRCGLIF